MNEPAKWLPNQAQPGLPNVLHDQGLPNTLAGVRPAKATAGLPWRGLTFVAVLATLAMLLAVFVTRMA